MAKTYSAVALNPSSWVTCHGIKVYDDIAACGHNHKTTKAAWVCMTKLQSQGSTLWLNAEVRNSNRMPIFDDENYAAYLANEEKN